MEASAVEFDHVADQHGQLSSLSVRPRSRQLDRRVSFGGFPPEKVSDCLEQLLAVPKRYIKTHQIFFRQVRQNIAVDRLIDEQGPVLAKPKFFKPCADVQTLHVPKP